MNKKIIPVILFCVLFIYGAISPAKADDYGDRLMKALGVSKKPGAEGLQQEREIGQLNMTLCTMTNIATALEMFSTDHSGKYPVSLNELSPNYLRNVPKGLSKAGYFPFAYIQKNGGKGYTFHCKGVNYPQFGIPADYPRRSADLNNLSFISETYLKPGVVMPSYREPAKKSKERYLFMKAFSQVPELVQKRDPKQAKDIRLNLTKAIQSGKLSPKEVERAKDLIESCKKIEQEKKK